MFDITHYPKLLEILHSSFFTTDSLFDISMNTLFAMVAGFGFAFGCIPPRKILFGIVFVAGFGYFLRSILVQSPLFSLAGASFCVSFCMGLLTMSLARRNKVPAEVIVFPALLPMFPGSYGYKSILSMLTFTQHAHKPEQLGYLMAFFNNISTMLSVSISLVAGALLTFLVFHEQSFMMTRGVKKTSIREILRDLKNNKKN